jgi:hypothetical protein
LYNFGSDSHSMTIGVRNSDRIQVTVGPGTYDP